jgi:cytochrome c5
VVAERLRPAGRVALAGETAEPAAATAPAAAAAPRSGEQVYTLACNACHGAGVAGAPKTGDAAAWATRLAQGKATLYKHAIEGFQGAGGIMPARGGLADLSDDEVRGAVDHMLGRIP